MGSEMCIRDRKSPVKMQLSLGRFSIKIPNFGKIFLDFLSNSCLLVLARNGSLTSSAENFTRKLLRNFFFKSGTSVGKTDFGKSWAKNHWSRKPLVSSPSLNNDDSPSCPVLGGAAIPPWRLLERRPSTRKIKD